MFLLIDNYDSFTYNLYHQMAVLSDDVRVVRNDAASAADIAGWRPQGLVISPGPGVPEDAGATMEVIRQLAGHCPIFGICLGHQAIGAVYGAEIVLAGAPVHGKMAMVSHRGQGVFEGLPSPFAATRYHSLVIRRESLPDCLEITAETEDGIIMGVRHREHDVEGVQFHPESIATEHGQRMMENFMRRAA